MHTHGQDGGESRHRSVDEEAPWVETQPTALRRCHPLAAAHVRIARPTDQLLAVVRFYREGLGLESLGSFEDHAGFDGLMLGLPGLMWHLEFTSKKGHAVGRAPSEDNLLVFYLPDVEEWRAAVARMEEAGYAAVRSFNPYWDQRGRTFEDPDGYRVVLQNGAWGKS